MLHKIYCNMTARSWVFTINNYTLEDIMQIEEAPFRYVIYGYEIGQNGTPHIQGYIEFDKPYRMAGVSKLLKRARLDKRRGSREQARDYCKKEGEFIELGNWNEGGQGTRNDLKEVMEMIKERKPMIEIMEEVPTTVANNLRFVDRYRELVEREQTREFRQVTVEAYVGDAGSGKTRKAHKENPGLFTVNPDESFPFEGYDGEETILIDDFYGDLKYHHLLRVLDGHQLRVNVKGSHRYARWNKVIITSNKKPEEWYRAGLTPALKRRITNVTMFCNEDTGNNMPCPLTNNETEDNILTDEEYLDI